MSKSLLFFSPLFLFTRWQINGLTASSLSKTLPPPFSSPFWPRLAKQEAAGYMNRREKSIRGKERLRELGGKTHRKVQGSVVGDES